jgi:signal peptide peptidase SppA
MTMLLRIAERVLNRPLLVHPDKVPIILGVLEGRIPIGDVSELRRCADEHIDRMPEAAQLVMRGPLPGASRFVGESIDEDPQTGAKRRLPYKRTKEGVAVITITGSLINRGAWVGSDSGETSYEGIKYQVASAAGDPKVRAILLDIESPGGEAVGAFEAAAAIRAAAAQKPVTAVVNGMAASAAYALASGATRIVTTETGLAGAVGVVMLHADYSRFLDKRGITPTLIFAGAHKVDGNPFEPLSTDVREDLQREVNQFYDLFVATVADGRRGLSPAAIRATEARTFLGAEAIDEGLADSVGTFEEVLADLSRGSSGRLPPTSSITKGTKMETKSGEVAANAATISKADHDAALAQARAEGVAGGKAELDAAVTKAKAEGVSEGANAERDRILGIDAIAVAGHDELIAACKADGKTTPEQTAMKILEAEKVTRGRQLAAIKGVETETAAVKAAPLAAGGGGDDVATGTPEGWKAEYAAQDAKGAALRAEFPTGVESYVAFKSAEAKGLVRRLVNRSA